MKDEDIAMQAILGLFFGSLSWIDNGRNSSFRHMPRSVGCACPYIPNGNEGNEKNTPLIQEYACSR